MLLSAADVGAWLGTRGLDATGAATELTGGVSNVVLSVDTAAGGVVVKQALPALRVPDEWLADRERALTEAAALERAARLTPDAVPRVLAVDAERCALAIERAPAGARCWKDDLLAGIADPAVATALGTTLRVWHDGLDGTGLGDAGALEQLRVTPYHRTVAERMPDVTDPVLAVAAELLTRRDGFVHGDFSPKNVLVGPVVWVLDFEVAHCGDQMFDVAFLLAHLVLKQQRECADAFLAAYGAYDEPRVLAHLGCLLLARVVGRSQVDYLTDERRRAVTALGRALLLDPPGALAEVW